MLSFLLAILVYPLFAVFQIYVLQTSTVSFSANGVLCLLTSVWVWQQKSQRTIRRGHCQILNLNWLNNSIEKIELDLRCAIYFAKIRWVVRMLFLPFIALRSEFIKENKKVRKQEKRKKELHQESDQEKRKTRARPRK